MNCNLANKEVGELLVMSQLRELRLGVAGDDDDPTSNKFTAKGFEAVLKALKQIPELAVLEMQLPDMQMSIGNW